MTTVDEVVTTIEKEDDDGSEPVMADAFLEFSELLAKLGMDCEYVQVTKYRWEKRASFSMYLDTKEEMVRWVKGLVRNYGQVKKVYTGSYFTASIELDSMALSLAVKRDEVCRKVVTGTKTETQKIPTAFEEKEVEVEEFEWVCDEPLLK